MSTRGLVINLVIGYVSILPISSKVSVAGKKTLTCRLVGLFRSMSVGKLGNWSNWSDWGAMKIPIT